MKIAMKITANSLINALKTKALDLEEIALLQAKRESNRNKNASRPNNRFSEKQI